MTKKVIEPSDGAAQVIYYENGGDNTVVKFSAGGRTVTSHSKTDSFGRKVFDELQLGTDFVSRQFAYHAGKVTDEHKENAKVKSSATTQLVSQIVLSGGRTLSYEYDAEERITKVTDSVDGVAEYVYDALGQLVSETVNGVVVNSMEYDNYGNITKKNGKAYGYDSVWKDLLVSYGGQSVAYDAQGNPVSYLGHNLTWEKGRQLKSFDGNTYTYNANGIRTSKTVGGIKHTYTLDGTKILRETWGENTLIPLYDNEDSVCGIDYNGEPYYFIRNLQGDVIAIVDRDSETVARYSYDAWGAVTKAETYTGLTDGVDIAAVNPFRYRGYYYDSEIGMYYLQSRYYDAGVGRFVNADAADSLDSVSKILESNLYAYCQNDPVNETDCSGQLLASKLAEIFLSAVFGMVAQLFDDLVIYFLKVLVHGKKNVKFEPNPSDYASRALSWALECINPFSGKKKWLNVILTLVPIVVKTIWDLASGKKVEIMDLLKDIFLLIASVIIANLLGRQTKRKIAELKKRCRKNKAEFKAQKLLIKAHFKTIGKKIDLAIEIAPTVVGTIFGILKNE